jgi:hypothetical protein
MRTGLTRASDRQGGSVGAAAVHRRAEEEPACHRAGELSSALSANIASLNGHHELLNRTTRCWCRCAAHPTFGTWPRLAGVGGRVGGCWRCVHSGWRVMTGDPHVTGGRGALTDRELSIRVARSHGHDAAWSGR